MGREFKSTLQQLDALSRTRELSPLETLRLERALRGSERKFERWHWSKADVLRLRRHLLNGKKPKQIALIMDRTERAVWRRMNSLGWTVREAAIWVINPSDAP